MSLCIKTVLVILSLKSINPVSSTLVGIEDLDDFLNALIGVVQQADDNKGAAIKPGFVFGAFVANLHLKYVREKRIEYIPEAKVSKLDRIINKLGHIDDIYYIMIEENYKDDISPEDKLVYNLFNNFTTWMPKMQPFKSNPKPVLRTFFDLQNKYLKYVTYSQKVESQDNFDPTPELFQDCIGRLAKHKIENISKRPPTCNIPQECTKTIYSGIDNGYSLTHRLLLLIMAKMSVHCSIKNSKADQQLVENLCHKAYDEGRYIAMHMFKLLDLLFEQVMMCTMYGYSEFFVQRWFDALLRHQTRAGCFTLGHRKKTRISKEALVNGTCDYHLSTGGIAALGASVRYIIETGYKEKILESESDLDDTEDEIPDETEEGLF